MSAERRARAFESFDRATELPMLVLSILIVPLVVIPFVVPLPEVMEDVLFTVDWIIWAIFAIELVVKTYLAPRRAHYLRTHWFDLLIVLLPLLRPLRIARSARALRALTAFRLVGVGGRIAFSVREILSHHGLHYSLLVGAILFVGSAVAVTHFEREGEGSIQDFGTALWWAAVTVTTVGYGDTFPVTPAGRGIGVFLMCVGITFFSLLTANIAAFFVETHEQAKGAATLDDVMAQLRRLEERIAELQESAGRSPSTGTQ